MTKRRREKSTESTVAPSEAVAPGESAQLDLLAWTKSWYQDTVETFDQFWFTPRAPFVLGWIRLFTGLIVFWSLLVWSFELDTFFGADGLLPIEYRQNFPGASGLWWSHLDWCQSSGTLWGAHVVALIIVAMFACGFCTRVTSVLTALLVISYGNRSFGAGFGLDQINAFLCLYCAVGNSGGAVSLDRWLSGKSNESRFNVRPDTMTNISIRLIQIHLCVVYFFAAVGKMEGQTWWSGEAVWLALSSYEYQTIDMTWLAKFMPLVALMTLVSLFWELFYPFLVWPRMTRPIMLLLAVVVHLGIGLCMGMMSFGLIMLVANLAFLCPDKADDLS